jgi:hypothetical protein
MSCDRIKEDDERMKSMKNIKCYEENIRLEDCLKQNDRDFRKCRDKLEQLKVCMVEGNNLNTNNNDKIKNSKN